MTKTSDRRGFLGRMLGIAAVPAVGRAAFAAPVAAPVTVTVHYPLLDSDITTHVSAKDAAPLLRALGIGR